MSAIKKAAAANFVWDLPSGQQVTAIGRNVSVSQRRSAEQSQLPTDDGETDGLVLYDPSCEATIEAILPTSVTLPDVGAVLAVTLDGTSRKYVVLDRNLSWTRKDWAKISLTAKSWDAMASAIGDATYPPPQGSGTT